MSGNGIRWIIEENVTFIRITAIAPITKISYMDKKILLYTITKMTDVIQEAQRFRGRVLETEPKMPAEDKTLAVCSTLVFDSLTNYCAFKNEFIKMFNQG